MQNELVENLPGSFTSLSNSHEPHLACVSLFLTFVHSISQKGWAWFHHKKKKEVRGVAFVPSERSIFNEFTGSCPSFCPLSELGGSIFRGTDLLAFGEN